MSGTGRFFARIAMLALLAGFSLTKVEGHESIAPPAGELTSASSGIFKEASAAVDAFHAALSSGDATAALALLVDDVQIFEQGEVERSKVEYGSNHLPSDIEFSRATQSAQTSRTGAMLGDFAYVASEGKITGRYKDHDINMITGETMVLRRDPDGRRIVHIRTTHAQLVAAAFAQPTTACACRAPFVERASINDHDGRRRDDRRDDRRDGHRPNGVHDGDGGVHRT